jgi:4-hydroxythreonine-4-phosphate dehydrogenase
MTKPLLVTIGEPSGIGPDICVDLVHSDDDIVVLGDRHVLKQRADMLQKQLIITDEHAPRKNGQLRVKHLPCINKVVPGCLDNQNAAMVVDMLDIGAKAVMAGEYSALVTCPIHKKHLQQVIPNFSGHTEFFQELSNVKQVVMMLVSTSMKVALVTTHLPLAQVSNAITQDKIIEVVNILDTSLKTQFGILDPKIAVAGLNPHAGEQGALGQEEIETIVPAIESLNRKGKHVLGPMSADTMFCDKAFDAYLVMYHDQGLPVIKYASFGNAANITLGLPFIRTSVDHGTALDIAGKGKANSGSLKTAIEIAKQMIMAKENM